MYAAVLIIRENALVSSYPGNTETVKYQIAKNCYCNRLVADFYLSILDPFKKLKSCEPQRPGRGGGLKLLTMGPLKSLLLGKTHIKKIGFVSG